MQDTKTPRLKPRSLWFGMLGAPAAWAAHFYLIWAWVEMGCGVGVQRSSWLGINVIHLGALALSLLAITVTVFAGRSAYQTYRALGGEESSDPTLEARAVERSRFMATVGMAFSALFLTIIVYVTVPVFVLPPCNALF